MSRGLMIALVSGVIVLTLGVAGVATYVFLVMPGKGSVEKPAAAETKAEAKVEAKVEESVPLKKFVTNLADQDRTRYIDLSVALGVKSAAAKTNVEKTEPQIRHVILSQIRSMTSQDLSGAAGKDKLAQAILAGLKGIPGLKEDLITVYVTDMVIQ